MAILKTLYTWYGKKTVLIVLGIIVLLAVAAFLLKGATTKEETEETATPPTVRTSTVRKLAVSDGATFIGTVRAVSEAEIQSEVGGRVTSVRVKAGDQVSAGSIIATLENAAQRASVLQAQGSYEAAVAAAAVSDVGVDQSKNALTTAQNSVISTNRSAYSTANNILLNTIDNFYSNPQSGIIGLALDGNAATLNAQRIALRTAYPAWSTSVSSQTATGDHQATLAQSKARVQDLLVLVDTFIAGIANTSKNKGLTETEKANIASSLSSAKSSLNATLTSLDSAATSLASAEESVRQAQIGGTNTDVSAANAQVKQALGGLRSAQASLAKTILRTPISGTVNTLSVNLGDFIGSFTPVAEIANNGSLEISIFLGERDLTKLSVGDKVLIEGSLPGVVANIAPALDSQTLKTEVKIATDATELTNGDTVTISLDSEPQERKDSEPLLVPITAVKFTATDGAMYFVEDGILSSKQIVLGPITGSYITIAEGIDVDSEFVIDVRGLNIGQKVEVSNTN